MDKGRVTNEIKGFLKKLNPKMDTQGIGGTTNLVAEGFLDSLRMVEMVIFIEKLVGSPIPIEDYDPQTFHSIDGIFNAFFKKAA